MPIEIETSMVNQLSETHFNNVVSDSSSFTSKPPPVDDFNVNTTCYHSVISTSLSKTINSSPISSESFNLCCDFNPSAVNQFSSNVDTYSSMVSSKLSTSYNEPLLGKSDVTFCTSSSSSSKVISEMPSDAKLLPNPPMEPVASKIDYFPSAVNSIVVSETGKKYPKKYSFYSNNFSSFLNQDTPFDKDCRSSNTEPSKLCELSCNTSVDRDVQSFTEMSQQMCSNIEPTNCNVHAETTVNAHLPGDAKMQTVERMMTASQTGSGELKVIVYNF